MVVTFRAYGAETYELNGKRDLPSGGYAAALGERGGTAGIIGAGTEDYQITDMEWLGESIRMIMGFSTAMPVVTGLRRVTDYQAVYQGSRQYFQRSGRNTWHCPRNRPQMNSLCRQRQKLLSGVRKHNCSRERTGTGSRPLHSQKHQNLFRYRIPSRQLLLKPTADRSFLESGYGGKQRKDLSSFPDS